MAARRLRSAVALVGLGNMGAPIGRAPARRRLPARGLQPHAEPRRSARRRAARRCSTRRRDAPARGRRLHHDARRRRRARGGRASASRRAARPRGGTTLVDMSTVSVGVVRAHRRARRRGAESTTSARPFSGNPGVVRGGNADDLRLGPEDVVGAARAAAGGDRAEGPLRRRGRAGARARSSRSRSSSAAPPSCSPRRSSSGRRPASSAARCSR